MEARKIMQIKNSFFINIPSSIAKELKLQKGDMLWVGKLSRDGLVLTKSKDAGKISAGVAGIDRINTVADEAHAKLRMFAKSLNKSLVFNIMNRLTTELIKSGLFDLKSVVSDAVNRLVVLEMKKKKAR